MYEEAQRLFKDVIVLVKNLPKEYRFEIGSQIIRSSLSVILNIAEGSGKSSDKELNRYLEISLGSLYETLACLDTLKLNSLMSEKEFLRFKIQIGNICDQLGGFKKVLDR